MMSPAGPWMRVAHAPSMSPVLRPIASCILGTYRSICWPGFRCAIMIVMDRSSSDLGSCPLPANMAGQYTGYPVASPLETRYTLPLYLYPALRMPRRSSARCPVPKIASASSRARGEGCISSMMWYKAGPVIFAIISGLGQSRLVSSMTRVLPAP